MNDIPKKWICIEDKLHADCKVYTVKAKTYQHPDGRKGVFYINESLDWVQCAPLLKNPKTGKLQTILVNQFRFGTNRQSWEFPGGVMDEGELPTTSAQRELIEETGYEGKSAKLIASYSPNPAIQNNLAHFVIIEDCKKVADTNWDDNEEIQMKIVDVDCLDELIANGDIYHSIAITSAYFLQKHLANTNKC